jgi:predicted acetylornithine/succinylornithine family transaminase/N-acetyl-ornithine/N-acetyl-lysine deacetylase
VLAVTSTIIETEDTYSSGVYSKRQVAIVRGEGALLWDEAGREYIDCVAGHGVANLGHGRSEIAAAIAEQALRLVTCPEIMYNDTRARLLERLAGLVPMEQARIFLCNSGTEAVEGALKFARLATGRTGIVATLRGFHGRSMGALSATWEPHYREPFAPLVPGFTHMRYNNLDAAREAISEHTAAVLIELVQGEGGVHAATQEYISGLVEICHERGALLIVDEVQTGFGRTGQLFASQHYSVEPDILCLAKALGGGLPMGAICLGQRVYAGGRISKGVHGTTFGGNPVVCAAALATLDILERENLPAHAAELGAFALQRLRAIHSPLIREVRGSGLLLGIELTTKVQPYLEQLCERGILALPAGPRVLRLLPPLVITQAQLAHVLDVIEEILTGSARAITSTTNSPEATCPEVALLHGMVSRTSYSGEESPVARYLVEQARGLGLEAHIDEAGNFVAGAGLDSDAQPLILLGHMDTVRGVVPIRIEDGKLYGRGSVDAKGPLAAFLCATARAAQTGTFTRPVLVIGAVEEEAATSRGARAVVGRYQPYACIIGEPSSSRAITLGYKGRLLIDGLVTRSISHTAGPEQSSSEIAAAFWERIRAHGADWNLEHAGNSTFAALMPSLRSINNQQDGLEERTSFTIGYRLPPGFEIATLRNQIEAWAAELDLQLRFRGEEMAFQSTRTTPLARAFGVALRATGVQPAFKVKTGTSDMNVVGPTWGENIVAYGPGDSRLDHTPDEHIEIDEYLHAIDVLERVLRGLAQPGGTAA